MKLYENISSVLSKKNINLAVGNIYDLMAIWKQWYRGNVNDFHYYNLRVNGKEVRCERKTMNMPKIESPMGLYIFANSIDRFKSIDTKYDSFCNEFELGKKRILVDQTTMKGQITVDEEGNQRFIQYFDANDKAYVAINGMEGQPVKEIDFKLRTQEHIDSINAELNWLSSNIGLGSNFYKFNGTSTKTATEVISENSDAFRTKVHYDIIVNDAVYDLVKVICEMEGIKTNKITIVSDDSIIEDKNTEQLRAQQEVSQGLRSKKSYLMDIKGMSEQEAEEELKKITEEKQNNAEIFGFPVNEEEE